MTASRSLSLKGCRTRAEALARFETWLEELHVENLHRLRVDILAGRDNGDFEGVDDDDVLSTVDAAVATARESWREDRTATLAQFDRFLAEHLRADIP
jgi:hypothetical protein